VTTGCPAPVGFLTVANTLNLPVNLGQGNFVPTQLIVTPDGARAYVLTSNSGSILVFNISSQSAPPPIGLTGGALPLSASLTPDGTRLYVASDDGTVHVIDTQGAADIQQISFPVDPSNPLLGGFCTGVAFPLQSVVGITAASPTGPNATTYTYTLTSGPGLQIGASIVITGMADTGNNGMFAVTALGAGTFTVRNANGVARTGQAGTGNVTISCNPDLIAVKP
jgi:YVTN family beta-propeller protein